ncbi:hypothetical protein AGMMS49531_11590 [Endomicrobiia bacterium]|nr:hypothetical protein AGMMS49531_11590 [Endomicrobiia bacterium]
METIKRQGKMKEILTIMLKTRLEKIAKKVMTAIIVFGMVISPAVEAMANPIITLRKQAASDQNSNPDSSSEDSDSFRLRISTSSTRNSTSTGRYIVGCRVADSKR